MFLLGLICHRHLKDEKNAETANLPIWSEVIHVEVKEVEVLDWYDVIESSTVRQDVCPTIGLAGLRISFRDS